MNLATTVLTLIVFAAADDAQWQVLTPKEGGPAPSEALYSYLAEQAHAAWNRRLEEYEQLKTPEQCVARQQQMREFFLKQLGGFPERTPLNARVAGRLSGEDYRVEKVIYESRPNHHVTAALYLPNSEPPFPAVLIACGHSKNGKAAGYNQRLGILLAKNGLAAMCYDPIGQGERSQILDENGKAKLGSTTEHTLVGVGAILLGINTAQYRIYDGIRGIDYLVSRPDIDPKRIGCTGCSGGGTLTSYIMALDDRVACAAPACYLTTFQRLIDTIGPQDAEQNIYGQIAFGMDQTDYVLMRAPKPTLICATTQDFFDIQGSWDNYRQSKRFYARLGFPERVDLVEDDDKHGVTPLNRGTLTHWMRRWLLGIDEHVTEPEFPLWTDEQLQCTPKGEVLLLPGEKSVFDLNAELAERLAAKRRDYWAKTSPQEARAAIRSAAGVRPLADLPQPQVHKVATLPRQSFSIEKLVLERDPAVPLPALIFIPAKPSGDAVLYLHGEGKHIDAGPGGPIETLVGEGCVVMAVDLPGIGETQSSRRVGQFGEFKSSFLAYLLGRSLVGMRTEDVLVCARFLAGYSATGKPQQVCLTAISQTGVPALHAAALEPQLFSSVQLCRTISSWEDVVRTPETTNQLVNTVHGALAICDLPNLVSLAGADKVSCKEPVNAAGEPVGNWAK